MKIKTKNVKRKETKCDTYRNIGLDITKPDKDEYIPARVARKAAKLFRTSTISVTDVYKFIEDEMAKYPTLSAITLKRQTEQVKALIGRYIAFDGRVYHSAYPEDFTFEGHILRVHPDFWLESKEYRVEFGGREVDVVEIFTLSAGRPEFFDGNRKGSVYHNLETCGNVLYGRKMLRGREGVVKVVYDYLKTSYDKHGDYSKPFVQAPSGKFTKSGYNNRLVFEVPIDKNGNVVFSHNLKLEKLFDNYKVSLLDYLNGVCSEDMSKGACEDCEFYDRCKGYSKRPEPKPEDKVVSKPMTRADFDISDEQNEVIGFREGICCVDAGPGSGKTFSVSMRIADMIVEGENPEDFLCLSFSNAAVKVMKERVDWLLNDVYMMSYDTSKMSIATFHGLANEIVMANYKDLGFSEKPNLIDDVEAIDLVRRAIDWSDPIDGFDYTNPLMKFGAGGVVPNFYRMFKDIKAFNFDKAGFSLYRKDLEAGVVDKVWETFERYKKLMMENNYIDYNDMELFVEGIISVNPNVITDKYDYKHIIVDEFQDSNDFQMLFINTLCLADSFTSLMVIGDYNQAIYQFRGTSPENFIHFDDKMGLDDVTDMSLTVNRRSTPEIVEISNQIIALNGNSRKIMKSYNANGDIPVFKDFEVDSAEMPWIAKQIKSLVDKGVKPSDIAFIAHKKSTLTKLQGLLSEEGVLALFDQPEELLTDSKVRASISLVKFLKDNTSNKGVFDYLCEFFGNSFMTKTNAQQIIEWEASYIIDLFGKFTDEDKKNALINLIKGLRDGSDNLFEAFIERLEGKTSYSYSQLVDYIIKFDKYQSDASAEKAGEYEAVSLVTAHSSKGKEWKHVFVSLSDFDSGRLTRAEMPEKIRLSYVACTRAELSLTVTCSKYRRTEGDTRPINRFWRCFSILPGFRMLKAS